MASSLQAKVDDACLGHLVEYSAFPHDEGADTTYLPLVIRPKKKVMAPSANSPDNTWVNPEYARCLPKLCAADLLGIEICSHMGALHAIALATEEIAVIWKLSGCASLPYDLELLLNGPIPKCGRKLSKYISGELVGKPLPLQVNTFRDLSLSYHSMRETQGLVTRPWEAYLGVRVPEASDAAWLGPVWTELMDAQLNGISSVAWASLMVCRAMERSRNSTLAQPYPFMSSGGELSVSLSQNRHAHQSLEALLRQVTEPVRLREYAVPASLVLGTFPDFKAGDMAPNISGDVWTHSHCWQTRNTPYPRMYSVVSVTTAVTLLEVNRGGELGRQALVRPGLIPACQVAPTADEERRRQRRHGERDDDGDAAAARDVGAYAKAMHTHRTKVDRSVSRVANSSFQYDVHASVTPLLSLGEELANLAVADVMALGPSSSASGGGRTTAADTHLWLHCKRLREFVRVALRLDVAPFALVTATCVVACKPSGVKPKRCEKRPLHPLFSHEMVQRREDRGRRN